MPSLLSALAANIIIDINVGSGGAEPTTTHIQQFLRDAARELWGELPPVSTETLTVSNLSTAPLAALRVYHVTSGARTLLRGAEWNTQGDNQLVFTPGAVGVGDTVAAFFTDDPGITDSSTVVDSSCLFGPDWLQPLMMVSAEIQVHNRISNVATSERADAHASLYRVKQARLGELKAAHKAVWDQWFSEMQMSIQARLQAGDRPYAEHPAAGFRNRSRTRTVWTG